MRLAMRTRIKQDTTENRRWYCLEHAAIVYSLPRDLLRFNMFSAELSNVIKGNLKDEISSLIVHLNENIINSLITLLAAP